MLLKQFRNIMADVDEHSDGKCEIFVFSLFNGREYEASWQFLERNNEVIVLTLVGDYPPVYVDVTAILSIQIPKMPS